MTARDAHTFREYHGENIPPYVITSHRWSNDETTYKDVLKKRNTTSKGWGKIEGFCDRVQSDNGLLKAFDNATCCDWIWVDTCCIDARSSAEVSESINSMFQWYADAQECYAYLTDVRSIPASGDVSEVLDDFRKSEWFRRGWTLQELVALKCVVFFTRTWEVIGHKCAYCTGAAK
ncbi:hypothetical protein LTS14_001043 [Recurvomyces mirabilis]|uniref:uncharacterized protein n=1 Tax=Recurvomyces mirabilis TaxID=574656 RepID=UPI002DE196EC|nr:hypothetical protein LTS14_001043 [Recurvomyces mirabilis]